MPFDLPELPKSEPSPGNGAAIPFRPSAHSMALRQGIGVSMQCAQMAQRAKLMPARDAKLDAILECLTHVLMTQAHLADAVLEAVEDRTGVIGLILAKALFGAPFIVFDADRHGSASVFCPLVIRRNRFRVIL